MKGHLSGVQFPLGVGGFPLHRFWVQIDTGAIVFSMGTGCSYSKGNVTIG